MKMTKRFSSFIVVLLVATTFNSYSMEKQPELSAWEQVVGGVLLGVAAVKMLWKTQQSNNPFEFTFLPEDIQKQIIHLLSLYTTAQSLKEAAFTINSLAQVNKELNQLINGPNFCLQLIEHLAQKFDCSDEEVAEALKTKEAKRRLAVQLQLADLCGLVEHVDIDKFFEEQGMNSNGFARVSFTFTYKQKRWQSGLPKGGAYTPLMLAAINSSGYMVNSLINLDVDINHANSNGITALMLAAYYDAYNAYFSVYSEDNALAKLVNARGIEINKQDLEGNTAFMLCCKKSDVSWLDIPVLTVLLGAGADPELADFKGLTPLQAAQQIGDQQVINFVQGAINNKKDAQQ